MSQTAEPSTPPAESVPPPSSTLFPRLARAAIAAFLADGTVMPHENPLCAGATPVETTALARPYACFVSIKTANGALRGCIGTILPTRPDLAREIIGNAISASTRDPRFPPMKAHELPTAVISVDLLGTPRPIRSLDELDPKKYGVIVTRNGRRGLLLPDLEGVDTVERQLSIAAGKGGITTLEGAEIARFTVDRYFEESGGNHG